MEEEHTTNSGGKGGKIDTIVYNTEVAEIEGVFTLICNHVKVTVSSIIAETL
jgi:hypothetical protein